MTDLEKAARMALEALERCVATCFDRYAHEQVMSRPEHFVNQAITALRQALEQPQDEWLTGCPECGMDGECGCDKDPRGCWSVRCQLGKVCKNTSPQRKPWVGLTPRERIMCRSYDPEETVAKTEAKLKEKNT